MARRGITRVLSTRCLLLLTVSLLPGSASAEDQSTDTLIVGTRHVPPFAMLSDEGNWTGISIDLWRRWPRTWTGPTCSASCRWPG